MPFTADLMIESFGKYHYCPLKDNRQVDDSTDWIVTNDPAADPTEATQEACGFR